MATSASTRPFDYVDGYVVDLKNEAHVKVVLERNKKLEFFSTNEFEADELPIEIRIEFSTTCPKCGSKMESATEIDAFNFHEFIQDHFSGIKCNCCGSAFRKRIAKNAYVFNSSVKNKTLEPIK